MLGRGPRPGVERSETPGPLAQKLLRARVAADSGSITKRLVTIPLSPAPRALIMARLDPGVYAPGFMPTSAPRTPERDSSYPVL